MNQAMKNNEKENKSSKERDREFVNDGSQLVPIP
jgi:hypothetical protein